MKSILTAAAALSLLAGAAAAQPRHFDDHHGGHHWRHGERLDNRYGGYQPVSDWRAHHLRAPRRGYHWVRSGDDYVEAALVGGLIASVVAASR